MHPITALRHHPRAADALLTTGVVAFAVGMHLWGDSTVDDPNEVDPAWWTVLLVLLGTVPIYWRRTQPLIAGTIVVAAEVLALYMGLSGAAFIGSMIAVYSIGAHTMGVVRTRVIIGIAVLVVALFVAGWIDGLALVDEFISTGVVLITAYVLGDNLRRRRIHVADLAERAERAEREHGLLAEQRVAAERNRIARDLHDVVAHSVSVMVIQAAAARRNLESAPADAAQALAAVESTGRQTMAELRAILGVLRTGGSDTVLDPQPSLTRLADLINDAELPIELLVEGDVSQLPESASVNGYRLVQEALTNVRRHAGTVDLVSISLVVDAERLMIEIVDDGRGAGAAPTPDGFGIIGMRERVTAIGGSIDIGPRRSGGWRVRAVVPLRADDRQPVGIAR